MPERGLSERDARAIREALQEVRREAVSAIRETRLRTEEIIDQVIPKEPPAARPELRLVVDNEKGGDDA